MMSVAEVASRTEIRCVAVTNGFVTRTVIRDVFRNIQAVNVELKSFEPSFYREYCKGRLEDVMRAIVELAELGLHIELSTLVIPDINDRPDVMRAQAAWIRDSIGMDTPLHLQAFVPTHRMTMIRPTALETLETLARVASDEGLRYVYVEDPASKFHHTRCRKCGRVLIERDGDTATSISLSPEGVCPTCGSEVPAVLY
jgi:pyruvate formate lyase activating enzyme